MKDCLALLAAVVLLCACAGPPPHYDPNLAPTIGQLLRSE